ncbi:diguanylate cyclase/phosphodiesterase with PAS/PAC and GAF sensor(s) [Pseudoalteromonas luteoviolacea B = ATCC 29581]|nr:diguanylate cyclase/phosphodiesterase with PAS/PAC and GAF sensor(s) [Pseudoalteromonas luteoviolacea B = ATCC 29581]
MFQDIFSKLSPREFVGLASLLNKSFSFNQWAVKVSSNTVVLSLREGYIALIPFFVVASLITLFVQLTHASMLSSYLVFLRDFNSLIWTLFPILSLISVSYHLSKNLKINSVSVPILVLMCFLTTTDFIYLDEQGLRIDPRSGVVYTLLFPILCSYLLKELTQIKWFKLVQHSDISLFLRKHLNFIFPYFLTTSIVFLAYPILDSLLNEVSEWLSIHQGELGDETKLYLQLVLAHLFWFVGIHGDNTFHIIFSPDVTHFELFPNMMMHQFYSNYVILGGTGCLWGIVIASLVLRGASHERQVAKLASPFAIFNISEIMIYALPIVFNPFLFIPFLLAPLVNAVIASTAIEIGLVSVAANVTIPWFTPVLLSGWWLSDGLSGVLLQTVLVLLNAAIYYPFLKANLTHNVSGKALDLLSKRFSAGREVEAQAESDFAIQRSKAKISAEALEVVSRTLNQGELTLFYQPKVCPISREIKGFEALLRLVDRQKGIQGPWFLPELEKHGLIHIIDNFVIDKLEVDIQQFAKHGLKPKISFNLSPQTFLNDGYKRVIHAFSKYPEQVEVELLESSYIEDFERTRDIVSKLKSYNIDCAMDDFGTGYSCLTVLAELNMKTIKLDRGLLPSKDNTNGEILYKCLADMCHELGFALVAEGIEDEVDEGIAKRAGITIVQGFRYSKALPIEQAMQHMKQSSLTTIA